MPARRDPHKTFSVVAVLAPTLFALGLYLYYRDRHVGAPYTVEEGGVLGLAANLSLIGLTAVVRLLIVLGPQLMILVAIALPVCGALYAVEQLDSRRSPINSSRRRTLWFVACGESLGMMALFIVSIDLLKV